MTREPFIAHSELTNEIYIVVGKEKYRVTEQAIKAVMAIKALEQEPCDDAISRQAVLEYIEGNEADLWHSSENELVCQDIKALPPVTPQQKNGKWLKGNSYGDQYNYYKSFVCSCCKREYEVHGWNYCPNCGAKMEVEE